MGAGGRDPAPACLSPGAVGKGSHPNEGLLLPWAAEVSLGKQRSRFFKIYFKGKVTEKMLHLLVHSLDGSVRGWARPEPSASSRFALCCSISRELGRKWSCQAQIGAQRDASAPGAAEPARPQCHLALF